MKHRGNMHTTAQGNLCEVMRFIIYFNDVKQIIIISNNNNNEHETKFKN